jgi:tetratricopeptide (TPR) repeat protein
MATRPCVLGLLVFLALSRMVAAEPTPTPEAVARWRMGQEALRNGQTDHAIDLFQQSLKIDSELTRNYLSLAAAYSAKGDDGRAVENLTRYVQQQPDHVVARAHLAEMLLKLKRPEAARVQFEHCERLFQDHPEIPADRLIHCESRLMELAEGGQDEYGEHLHRGIGLHLLACQRALLPDPDDEHAVEGVLFKAVAELSAALTLQPDAARPCWYLYKVWSRLGQPHPAQRWLHAAEDAAPLNDLTPAERRDLQAACRRASLLPSRK